MKKEDVFEINITMLGGRRCGKTTTLASMYKNFKDIFSGTVLQLKKENKATTEILNNKINEIEKYFTLGNKHFTPDGSPTGGFVDYSFLLELLNKKGKDNNIKLTFNDMGGEAMISDAINHKSLEDKIKVSDVLIISIDTPYLLEEKGRYNNSRNNIVEIEDLITECFEKSEDEKKYKMVLFVPIKCERYYYNKKIDKVFSAVESCYKNLIKCIKSYCYTAIMPVETMGGLIFQRFGRDDNYQYKIDPKYEYPNEPIYAFRVDEMYNPKYCEKPLLYTIFYALSIMEMSISDRETKMSKSFFGLGSLFNKFREKVLKHPTSKDFMEQIKLIEEKMKINNEFVKIISNPLNVKEI